MTNLAVRTISGIGFVIVMLVCLLFNQFLFAAFVAFIMAVMMAEFYKMTMGEDYRLSRILAIITGEILFLLVFFARAYGLPARLIPLAVIPLFAVMVSSLYVRDKSNYSKFAFIYTGFLYIAVPLSLSSFIAFRDEEFNAMLLLCFFTIIWCSDVGAYCFGSIWGQKYGRKLFPSVSPKKSWVGFWGGLVMSVVATVVLYLTHLFQFPMIHCVILGILMHVAGVFGDLFESQWKRVCGVKDSGNIIPGHGGLLDRFDSSLISIPVGAIYLTIVNLI